MTSPGRRDAEEESVLAIVLSYAACSVLVVAVGVISFGIAWLAGR